MTCISWFSDFASYFEGYLMYKHDNVLMSQYDLTFDLKIKRVTVTYISWFSDFASHFEGYLMYKHDNVG